MWKAVVVACFEIAFGKTQGNHSNLQPVYPVCGWKFEPETYGIRGIGTTLRCDVPVISAVVRSAFVALILTKKI
jgi:hypothetical protein